MNGLIGLAGTATILLLAGLAMGCLSRRTFAPRWLLAGVGLVALNDALLTRCYGLLPDFLGGHWNWQGKLLALAATLAIAALPAFGWRRAGFTLRQAPGSLKAAVPVALLYCGFFLAVALMFPGGPGTAEDAAFQLTMPGFEEEPFYRGILLLALDRAFPGRWHFLGVEWSWASVLSCVAFGLAHAFVFSEGHFAFDPLTMALTALPSFLAVWLRLRTGSVALPVLLHNFGNSISLLI